MVWYMHDLVHAWSSTCMVYMHGNRRPQPWPAGPPDTRTRLMDITLRQDWSATLYHYYHYYLLMRVVHHPAVQLGYGQNSEQAAPKYVDIVRV